MAGLLIPLVIVWIAVVLIMALGVQKGVGATSVIFIPVLVLAFLALVVRSLFLPGAGDGLNALFTPDWAALSDTGVWAAAYSQIFFSLSIGFGIMITYSSYVGRKTDMTGSGLVVGFANSSFELLCGIGVFSASASWPRRRASTSPRSPPAARDWRSWPSRRSSTRRPPAS